MSIDRNKSELTHNITRNVALWMDGKGFKPVETEVPVANGWIADVAGVCCPTQTEMIDLKILTRAPRRLSAHYAHEDNAYSEACRAWYALQKEIPQPLTALVEVKTSRGDYMGDRKWTAEWPTNLCYVAMPDGMIEPRLWPAGWGVLLFSQEGTTIRKVHGPKKIQPIAQAEQLGTVLALAVARDHQTRYARLRELQKEIRIKDGEYKTVCRVSAAIRFVRSVAGGMSIEEALNFHYMKVKLPEHVLLELEELRPKPINA